jgi:hypothetical protein
MWINPTYPIYNWGYNPLTKWDEPPSRNPDGYFWIPIHGWLSLQKKKRVDTTSLDHGHIS